MNRREWIKHTTLGTAGLLAAPTLYAQSNKPNFVMILADDLGWKDLTCMGSRYYETPNIDRLASQGMTFTNVYANAPNCAPTRACLLSGQYTPRHGIYTVGTSLRGKSQDRQLIPIETKQNLSPDCITLAETLRKAGYTTAHFGKWHLGDTKKYNPLAQGFEVYKDRQELGYQAFHFARKEFTKDPEPEYLTDRLTEEACAFMRQNKERPFFVNLWHHAVHVPIQAKKQIIEKYKNKPPANGHFDPTYAAMIESLDQSVGHVMATLDELGLAENTVLLFFSDNGGYGPITSMQPLRGSKGMLYEGGIREPMIIRWPKRVQADSQCDTPVIGLDFYPTFMQIAGAPVPNQPLDGRSLLPLLEGTGAIDREALFWHFPCYLEAYVKNAGPWRTTPAGAIRKGDFKLIEFFEDSRLELYNVVEDVSEATNLAHAMPEKTKALHDELKAWRTTIGAPVPVDRNPEYIPLEKREQ